MTQVASAASESETTKQKPIPAGVWPGFLAICVTIGVALLIDQSFVAPSFVSFACVGLMAFAGFGWLILVFETIIRLRAAIDHPSSFLWLLAPLIGAAAVVLLLSFGVPLKARFVLTQHEFEAVVDQVEADPTASRWGTERTVGGMPVISVDRSGDATYFVTDRVGLFSFGEAGLVHLPHGPERQDDLRPATTFEHLWGDWYTFIWSD